MRRWLYLIVMNLSVGEVGDDSLNNLHFFLIKLFSYGDTVQVVILDHFSNFEMVQKLKIIN